MRLIKTTKNKQNAFLSFPNSSQYYFSTINNGFKILVRFLKRASFISFRSKLPVFQVFSITHSNLVHLFGLNKKKKHFISFKLKKFNQKKILITLTWKFTTMIIERFEKRYFTILSFEILITPIYINELIKKSIYIFKKIY